MDDPSFLGPLKAHAAERRGLAALTTPIKPGEEGDAILDSIKDNFRGSRRPHAIVEYPNGTREFWGVQSKPPRPDQRRKSFAEKERARIRKNELAKARDRASRAAGL